MARYVPTFEPEECDRVLGRKTWSHPLEMFPWFRRERPGFASDIAYTFIWNLGFTALFLFIGAVVAWRGPSAGTLWVTFVISNCVGYTLHFIFALAGRSIEPAVRRLGRVTVAAYYMVASTIGAIVGFWLATLVLGRQVLPRIGDLQWITLVAISSMVISVVIAIIYFWREKTALAEAALERE